MNSYVDPFPETVRHETPEEYEKRRLVVDELNRETEEQPRELESKDFDRGFEAGWAAAVRHHGIYA